MSLPRIERPDLPEYMTWEELEQLPEGIADQIELWLDEWCGCGADLPSTSFTRRVTNAFEPCARKDMSNQPDTCWRVESETNVFLSASGKSDFLTPDFFIGIIILRTTIEHWDFGFWQAFTWRSTSRSAALMLQPLLSRSISEATRIVPRSVSLFGTRSLVGVG
ncbi:hypothetical protein [Nocardia nova]|uniref:hypothetical protein n=1 Tax=Nocardia nova TaxID=37330 RepID=UPI0026ABA07B|nr:hypothetical protein [Nocardia nova]